MPRLLLILPLLAAPVFAQAPPSGASAQARPAAVAPRPAPIASIFTDRSARALAEEGVQAVYDLRWEEVARIAGLLDARDAQHPAAPFLRGMATHWRILIDLTNAQYDPHLMRQMDEVIRRADARLDRNRGDFDARFFRGAALAFQGRLKGNRSEYVDAARKGRSAMNDVMDVARRNPANPDFGFGRGLYDYYADVVRERYVFARPLLLFFPDADRARGLAALRRAAEQGTFMRTEAAYFLSQIYYVYEDDYAEAMRYTQMLRTRHPQNPFFLALEGRIEGRWGRWAESRQAFERVLAAYDAGRAEYVGLAEQALYYLARADMGQAQFEAALEHLGRLETLTSRFPANSPSYYRVHGRLRQGMALDALGRRDEAEARYREVTEMTDYGGTRDRARRYLERPYQ
jgi:tetratricopeptide (TPR) repeat protein